MRQVEIYNGDCIVTINDDQATKEKVFERLVDYCRKTHCFSGEGLYQSDDPQIQGLELLSDLMDEVLYVSSRHPKDEVSDE